MNFKWMTDYDQEMFRSLKGLVNNGGFFKSSGQAAFFEKRVRTDSHHVGPCTAWDNSVDVAEGQYAIICEGLVGSGEVNYVDNWGSRARRKAWIFVIDEVGVVKMFIGRCKHYSDGSAPNGEKTVREFVRTDEGRAHDLAKSFADERAAKAKAIGDKRAASTHVGEVGERIEVEGFARLITSFDNEYGTSYMYMIEDADGNAYKFIGTSIHTSEQSADRRIAFKIKAKFTVKSHDEYNGQKQTVVNRPKIIERESMGAAA
jgi:hypothetical protein